MSEQTPAQHVTDVIQNLKRADEIRGANRVIILNLFNGNPPYSPAQMAENKIDVSFSSKSGTNLLAAARRQYENALLKPAKFFHVSLEDAPPERGLEWANIITKEINKRMKRSRSYFQTVRETGAGVMLHGIGPKMWEDQEKWEPYYVALENLLIPTDTQCNLDMPHFAGRREMTYYQLWKKTLGKGENMDPGWNKKAVQKLLQAIKNQFTSTQNWDWIATPERAAELLKQNATLFESDIVPKLCFWDWYEQDDKTGEWFLKIVLDQDYGSAQGALSDPLDFIYEGRKPVSDTLDKILQVQYGDGNPRSPFFYHSVRSLGFLLFDLCQVNDMTLCRFVQKVHEDYMLLLRVQDPADRAAIDKIHFGLRYGLLPDGVSFVKREERYQIDPNLTEMLFSIMKQHIGESASTYTQDVDSGTEKERTKFEVQAILAQTSALMSTLLTNIYTQVEWEYAEICRRFCLKETRDKDAKSFQKACVDQGVPEKWLNSDRWEVKAEMTLGGGNKMLEISQAQQLMSVRQFMDPSSQAAVLHDYVLALTDDPGRANRYAPLKPTKITDTVFETAQTWGTLMTGQPMPVREGDSHREVIETLLRMMDMKVQQIEQSGGVGMPQDVVGITNAAAYVTQHIDLLEQDESEAQRVKQYRDFLGKLGNQVKAFAQRQQEMAAQQNGHQDPETMAKVASIAATTQAKVQAKQVSDQQKLAQKEAAFRQKQAHEMEKTRADVFVAGMEGVAETAAQHAKTAAEVRAIERKAEAEAKAAAKKASATKNKE